MSLISSLIPSFASTALGRGESTPAAGAASAPVVDESTPRVTPRYQLSETSEAYGLTVELPGVARDGLELSVDHEQVRVLGRRAWRQPDGWNVLHRESAEAVFELSVDHGREVDVEKVHAELRDGVLRVSLPKLAALKPRKIAVA
jgi:HSP20 family molecular chaperone IbpA